MLANRSLLANSAPPYELGQKVLFPDQPNKIISIDGLDYLKTGETLSESEEYQEFFDKFGEDFPVSESISAFEKLHASPSGDVRAVVLTDKWLITLNTNYKIFKWDRKNSSTPAVETSMKVSFVADTTFIATRNLNGFIYVFFSDRTVFKFEEESGDFVNSFLIPNSVQRVWELIDTPTGFAIFGWKFGAYNRITRFESTDLENWGSATDDSTISQVVNKTVYGDGYYVSTKEREFFVGTDIGKLGETSAVFRVDGNFIPSNATPYGIVYFKGAWYATILNIGIVKSTDLSTWQTVHPLPFSGRRRIQDTDIMFSAGEALYVKTSVNAGYFWTVDGTNWNAIDSTAVLAGTNVNGKTFMLFGSTLYATNAKGEIYQTNLPEKTFSPEKEEEFGMTRYVRVK